MIGSMSLMHGQTVVIPERMRGPRNHIEQLLHRRRHLAVKILGLMSLSVIDENSIGARSNALTQLFRVTLYLITTGHGLGHHVLWMPSKLPAGSSRRGLWASHVEDLAGPTFEILDDEVPMPTPVLAAEDLELAAAPVQGPQLQALVQPPQGPAQLPMPPAVPIAPAPNPPQLPPVFAPPARLPAAGQPAALEPGA